MKKLLITCLIAGLTVPFVASAQWELIADFESEDSLDAWFFSDRLSRNEVAPEDWDSTYGIVPRPFDDLGGRALSVSEGSIRWQIFDVGLNMGPLPINNTFTLFYEIALSDLTPDVVAGLHTGIPEDWFFQNDEGLWVERYAYAHYSTVHRMGRVGLNAHNGVGFSPNYSDNQMPQTWYRFWMVVNPLDFTWNLFVQGGEIEEITQVTTNYDWRNLVFDPLETFRLRVQGNTATASSTGAPTFFDNLFLDRTGQNLTLPPRTGGEVIVMGPGIFSPYVVTDGWVDTGDWMGWVTVDNYPFVYIYDFDSWAYAAGISSPRGAWIFVVDLSEPTTPAGEAGPGVFSGYSVENGWVDTGDWMGMVFVGDYPSLYSHSLASWASAPEPDTSSEEAEASVAEADVSGGAWIHVFK